MRVAIILLSGWLCLWMIQVEIGQAAPLPVTECHGLRIDPHDLLEPYTYWAFIKKDGVELPVSLLGTRTQVNCVDLPLRPGAQYEVSVLAVNSKGTQSERTAPIAFIWETPGIEALKVCLDIVVRIKGKPKQLCLMVE